MATVFTVQQQEQTISKVMSIGAITSSCSNDYNTQEAPTIHEPKQPPPADYLLPPLTQQFNGFSATTVGHWVNYMDRDVSTINMIHSSDSDSHFLKRRVRLGSNGSTTTTIPSPSFSSSSSSDHGSNSSSITSPILCTQNLSSLSNFHKDNCNSRDLYVKQAMATESLLDNFDMEDHNAAVRSRLTSIDYNKNQNDSNLIARKNCDALATRRARNKLASAKYRAKKQALTHAMQDRIMQLATQIMSLQDELFRTKRNETKILIRYERLLKTKQYYNSSQEQ